MFHKNECDLIYHGLNVSIIKDFISSKKIKQKKITEDCQPIHYSYSHIKKYQDAILYGDVRCRQSRPKEYEIEMIFFIL